MLLQQIHDTSLASYLTIFESTIFSWIDQFYKFAYSWNRLRWITWIFPSSIINLKILKSSKYLCEIELYSIDIFHFVAALCKRLNFWRTSKFCSCERENLPNIEVVMVTDIRLQGFLVLTILQTVSLIALYYVTRP